MKINEREATFLYIFIEVCDVPFDLDYDAFDTWIEENVNLPFSDLDHIDINGNTAILRYLRDNG